MVAQCAQLNPVNVGVIDVVYAQVYQWDQRLRLQNLIFNLLVHACTLHWLKNPAGELQPAVQFLIMKTHIVHV